MYKGIFRVEVTVYFNVVEAYFAMKNQTNIDQLKQFYGFECLKVARKKVI